MDMRDVILTSPEQITHSLEVNKDVKIEGQFDTIIFSCIGGSGHPGDLANALHIPRVPLIVHRGYDLPFFLGKHPLVIASSYSGNTEEPMTGYKAAQQAKYPIMVNTAGGTLEEWAKRDGTPVIKIDFPDMQPRHTLLASFTGVAVALKNSGLAEDITENLQKTAQNLKVIVPQLEEEGKALAKQFKGKIPIIYASSNLAFTAKNFKIQLNENTKTPAFWHEFPELNHNEMLGFSKLAQQANSAKFHTLLIRDKDDHPRTRARMDVTKQLYKEWGVEVSDLPVRGETLIDKIFYTVSVGLWVSYYLALEYNIDPIPVEGVESFKAKLKEIAGEV